MGPRYFDRRRGLLGAWRLAGGRRFEHLWPFTCAWSAVETAAGLGGDIGSRAAAAADGLARGLLAFLPPQAGERSEQADPRPDQACFESSVTPPLGPGGGVFYDDNAWVALALLARHRRLGDADGLALARRVVSCCCSGWSSEGGWSHAGGIRWKAEAANRSRNTCANGPSAEAAAMVHARTGDRATLEWALRIYEWTRRALGDPDGLYLDRIMPDGWRVPDYWSYNQGTMVGAAVLLADATGEARYLEEARATAGAALARFDVERLLSPNGPAFNAVFFRNLFLLDRRAADSRITALAAAYGERTWAEGPVLAGPRARRVPLNDVAPLLQLYALLAGAEPHP